MLSLLTLNLQAAAVPRAGRILDWLAARDDHTIVLTETSNGPGTAYLLDRCHEAGLLVAYRPSPDGDRGCALISRVPATLRSELTDRISLPGRAVAVTLDTDPPVTLLGIYVPSSDRAPAKVAKKKAFLSSTIEAVAEIPAHERRRLVLTGDYNVIHRGHTPTYPAFQAFEYAFLDQLADLGLTDVHQHLHPGDQVHSWYGRGGNGYRFDYFHTGDAVTVAAVSYRHLEDPRTTGLSDHDAIAFTMATAAPRLLPTTDLTSAARTLF
ncbi:endonuclease/exonuclease/phosphatase family protein [Actinoplanes sp. NPDC049118]|uniref:endonuclease/exonuclease/phosphatase family protein n=1 Tax=Actinoplanes sp. NPDC049118 TaxID=3155769 RepID=UPI0033CE178D